MDPKQQLQKIISDLETKKFRDGEAKGLVETIGGEIKKQLSPLFESMGKDLSGNVSKSVADAIKGLKVDIPKSEAAQVHVNVPDVVVPAFNIPTPKVTVNIPKGDTPNVTVQPTPVTFPDSMSLRPGNKPFPVIMMDQGGKPMQFPQPVGGSEGHADFFTIIGITSTVNTFLNNPSGPINGTNPFPITGSLTAVTTVTGITNTVNVRLDSPDGLYSATNAFPVKVVGGAAGTSVSFVNSDGNYYNSDNPFPVTITSGSTATSATNIVDSSGIAYSGSNPIPVTITSGASSTSASNIVDSSGVAYSGSNPVPVTLVSGGSSTTASNIVDSSGIAYSGSNPLPIIGPVVVSSVTASIAAALIDSGGVEYSGSNPFPVTILGSITQNVAVTSVTTTLAANIVDSSGVAYSGSNPFIVDSNDALGQGDTTSAIRTVQAGDSISSVSVTGFVTSIAATIIDSGGVGYSTTNPIPITTVAGGPDSMFVRVAHTTFPTAVADGADVRPMADKLGRQVMRTIQVRDLIATAYGTVSTTAETTLITASAGQFLDLISITITNSSTAAAQIDLRALVAGNIEQTFLIPAGATSGWTPPVPWPMSNTGNAWTFKNPGTDISGTTITVNALFTKEI